MAANHPTTATQLDSLTTAVELLTDHGYDVTTATISVDASPESTRDATITLELAVPKAADSRSEPASLDEGAADFGTDTGDADDTVPEANGDAAEAAANRDTGSVDLDAAVPVQRGDETERTAAEPAAPLGSSQDAEDAGTEETTDECWCRKCGYGPGTKRAIAIHNGHKHGDDAEYASTEPAPEEVTETETPRRTPEEIDAIVEDIVADPSTAESDAPEQPPGDASRESIGSTGDRFRDGDGNDASFASPDGGNSVDVPPSDVSDEPVTELPDLDFPIPDRVTVDAVRAAVDEADDLGDVQESLKWPAGQCRILLQEMNLGTELLDAAPKAGYRLRSKRTV